MKKNCLLGIFLLLGIFAMAQKPIAKFSTTNHDFGTIKEEDGKVTFIFEVTNAGNSDLLMTQVQTSCGCTAREYTRQPIAPNKKGEVSVTYDPAGRPGPFKKTITVNNNSEKAKITLSIKGEVIPKKK